MHMWVYLVRGYRIRPNNAERRPGAELHERNDGAKDGEERSAKFEAPRPLGQSLQVRGLHNGAQPGHPHQNHYQVGASQDYDVDEAGSEGAELIRNGGPRAVELRLAE